LNRNTLRKYGVGCARYNFPEIAAKKKFNANGDNASGSSSSVGGGISYVSSACVTFPWMMRAGEVEELEGMRGLVHSWRTTAVPCNESDDADVEGDDGTSAFIALTTIVATTKHEKKRDKTVTEMTPLERYHHRRERKE
jgi:hypothetical protein